MVVALWRFWSVIIVLRYSERSVCLGILVLDLNFSELSSLKVRLEESWAKLGAFPRPPRSLSVFFPNSVIPFLNEIGGMPHFKKKDI